MNTNQERENSSIAKKHLPSVNFKLPKNKKLYIILAIICAIWIPRIWWYWNSNYTALEYDYIFVVCHRHEAPSYKDGNVTVSPLSCHSIWYWPDKGYYRNSTLYGSPGENALVSIMMRLPDIIISIKEKLWRDNLLEAECFYNGDWSKDPHKDVCKNFFSELGTIAKGHLVGEQIKTRVATNSFYTYSGAKEPLAELVKKYDTEDYYIRIRGKYFTCIYLKNTEPPMDVCRRDYQAYTPKLAIKYREYSSDAASCYNTDSGKYDERCLDKVAVYTNDIKVCDLANDIKAQCYYHIICGKTNLSMYDCYETKVPPAKITNIKLETWLSTLRGPTETMVSLTFSFTPIWGISSPGNVVGGKVKEVIIERSDNPSGPFIKIGVSPGIYNDNFYKYSDFDVKLEKTYYYRAKAINLAGESPYSDIAQIKVNLDRY